jgi:hypothetical protein
MKRHDQRRIPKNTVCHNCKADNCAECVDVVRILAGLYDKYGALCHCRRKGHDGEPADQQILDPEINTVWAPGLHVEEDGTVVRSGQH